MQLEKCMSWFERFFSVVYLQVKCSQRKVDWVHGWPTVRFAPRHKANGARG